MGYSLVTVQLVLVNSIAKGRGGGGGFRIIFIVYFLNLNSTACANIKNKKSVVKVSPRGLPPGPLPLCTVNSHPISALSTLYNLHHTVLLNQIIILREDTAVVRELYNKFSFNVSDNSL